MAEIEVWMAVRDCRENVSRTNLWKRTIDTPFLPREGDVMWVGGESIDAPVKRPVWNEDGSVTVILREYWIDPPPPYDNSSSKQFSQWWSDQDGDLFEILEEAGWHH